MNFMNKKLYKIAFFTATFAVLILALIPNGGGIDTGWDKANHFIAFFTLSFLLNRASSSINARIRNALSLLAFGMLIEIFQAFTSYRNSDWHDIVADGIGILAFQVSLSSVRFYRSKLAGQGAI
jgi:VanZ family protein